MRPVHHSDVTSAAHALSRYPEAARVEAMQALIQRAHAADLYRKRLGRAHPLWGNGSLLAASGQATTGVADFRDPDFLQCMVIVIETLLWRGARSIANA